SRGDGVSFAQSNEYRDVARTECRSRGRSRGKGGLVRLAIIVKDVILLPRNPMNKRQWDTVLYGIAEDQAGYFTAAQARSAGLHQVRLVQLAQQGDIERVSRGVYRFARF